MPDTLGAHYVGPFIIVIMSKYPAFQPPITPAFCQLGVSSSSSSLGFSCAIFPAWKLAHFLRQLRLSSKRVAFSQLAVLESIHSFIKLKERRNKRRRVSADDILKMQLERKTGLGKRESKIRERVDKRQEEERCFVGWLSTEWVLGI